ncbi:beta-N-acetylhexosaminidase [Chitinophaga caeni]|uniref:beta-N-acetylhexosaminidase n=1 Tax=Chitinophaga caeni TaxID=2029983 RepID=A0A291QUM3_9BACT|nr:family 20 glycosylhydrolase [Chitinophaga caeni]ATL47635.1 beta-N-acetylhexosaminidase [Chitinophaga caeni]
MKKLVLFTLSTLLCVSAFSQRKRYYKKRPTPQVASAPILPEPAEMKVLPGSFTLTPLIKVYTQGEAAEKTLELLNLFLDENYGFRLENKAASANETHSIALIEDDSYPEPEGYQLTIANNKILIKGQGAGLFYGLQTFNRLLPLEHIQKLVIRNVQINDKPRFAYRGLMLDVCRHFMPMTYVKKYIDIMSQYKFNRFHFHLTDDQGWRVEIKKYPRLQSIASSRKETLVGRLGQSSQYDGKEHAGYYTQAELRDLVKYAEDRHVTIIPEIEMPGHALAALAAYPYLGCTGGPYEVGEKWGVFKDVYCAGNDSVFLFLQDVLDEVIQIFPGKYIHIGGDECPKDRWKECPKCQKRIKDLHLKNEHDLQSYFITRMEKYLNSKGRQIIGWDEILEGGLAPNATVMSWRGEQGGIEAAKQKHDVIMTPNQYLYLDYYQGDPATEPYLNIGGNLPLSKVYNYEPLPAELTAEEKKYIKGVQANVWTEYIPNGTVADYMTYPRALAVAEIAWSPAAKKDYGEFLKKLENALFRLDQHYVNFRVPEPVGLEDVVTTQNAVRVSLKPPVKSSIIRYTLDGSEPTNSSPLYTAPFNIQLPDGSTKTLKCVVMLPSGRKSKVFTATYTHKSYLAATPAVPKGQGLSYKTVNQRLDIKSPIPSANAQSGIANDIDINKFSVNSPFTVEYSGYLQIPADGLYECSLSSDDGSVMYIGDELVVDNDGEHGAVLKKSSIPLRKGYHKFVIRYFDLGGGKSLQAKIGIQGKTALGLSKMVFHD